MQLKKQSGFTLVEIAIVLVIIGLLLGGILKGQELINSARVRNLADQNSGIQAAYYGFIDRYRQVPGDFKKADAQTAIGQTITLGGDGNGQIDNTLTEAAAVWEQLSKANFIQGSYNPTAAPADEDTYRDVAPVNAFNGALTLTRNDDYTADAAAPAATDRLNLHLGTNIPVNIARELDVKVDDSVPTAGILRITTATAPWATVHDADATCVDEGVDPDVYDIAKDAQSCGVVYLY